MGRGWEVEKSYLMPLVRCLVRQVVGYYFLLTRNKSPADKRKRQAIAHVKHTFHRNNQRNP